MLITQSIMGEDQYLRLRVASAAAQEGIALVGIHPDKWTLEWRRVWSAAPEWDVKWEEAQTRGITEIGRHPDTITDEMIITQVKLMEPFHMIESNLAEPSAPFSRMGVPGAEEEARRYVDHAVKLAEEQFTTRMDNMMNAYNLLEQQVLGQ